jgi:hypothetical protein
MTMRTALCLTAAGLGLLLLAAMPAAADHNSLVSSERDAPASADRSSSLDVDLKLGVKGFRLGARVFGAQGYRGGAWLNGETRADGFSVDGRVEREGGRAWNFKLNADIDAALRHAMQWWGGLREQ